MHMIPKITHIARVILNNSHAFPLQFWTSGSNRNSSSNSLFPPFAEDLQTCIKTEQPSIQYFNIYTSSYMYKMRKRVWDKHTMLWWKNVLTWLNNNQFKTHYMRHKCVAPFKPLKTDLPKCVLSWYIYCIYTLIVVFMEYN
jgi:hypothetical protein